MIEQVKTDRIATEKFAKEHGFTFVGGDKLRSQYFIGTVNGESVERNRRTKNLSVTINGATYNID